jgi:glycosyltransferase involved in cell wall biosynthesis
MVVSKIIADQLSWEAENGFLVAENSQDFAEKIIRLYFNEPLWNKIRNNAAEIAGREYSSEVFNESLKKALSFQ